MMTVGTSVRLADGRVGYVKQLMDFGVIELASPLGGFMCFSHMECVKAVTAPEILGASLRGVAADARSVSEDAAATPRRRAASLTSRSHGQVNRSVAIAAERCNCLTPDGNHGDNQLSSKPSGLANQEASK